MNPSRFQDQGTKFSLLLRRLTRRRLEQHGARHGGAKGPYGRRAMSTALTFESLEKRLPLAGIVVNETGSS
jgi:hypothetical protein